MQLGSPENEVKKNLPSILVKMASDSQIDGITRFQKLVFILQQGDLINHEPLKDSAQFKYEPHNYGPYSKELHDELDRLDRQGIINKQSIRTPAGNEKQIFELSDDYDIEDGIIQDLDIELSRLLRTLDEYEDMPLLELLDIVYEEYPKYAAESNL